MSTRQPRKANSSRVIAMAALAVLIVVAVAGIVLAGLDRSPTPVPTAPAMARPASSTSNGAVAPTSAPLDDVTFAAGSDKLPPEASQTIARFAETARGGGNRIRLTARYLTGENKARDLQLAQARTAAVRHAFEVDGVTGEHLQTELVEMPPGGFQARDANRVELTLR